MARPKPDIIRQIRRHARRTRLMARWGLPAGLVLGFLTGWMDWF